ncbi:putative inner membrane protein [Rhodobacteraceae bacterium THAF1]|uniref:YeeE/YedE family protein n=1 Tax=Palleronia sp. THAF1 TaxID=2587842 RepID=UPI000F3CF42B|nr:YeeE/YedE family protein [Palleronia sp. THAF1]QFU09070.1 putative inner membrane protein [Palleronia sp. THAF1]VDC24129.1 putative inner membrane protein [Rhodobacteraceae bacterium THAF1]
MFDLLSEPALAALIGLGGGIVLGLAARLGRFCTLGAIEDQLYGNSSARLRMWGVAIGVAVVATFGLIAINLLEPTSSFHIAQSFSLPGAVMGGLVFGYGMALCGNCGYGALARLGGGDMRAFVIVGVMGITAYATIAGPLSGVRVSAFGRGASEQPQGIAQALEAVTGLSATAIGLTLGIAIVAVTLRGARAAGMNGKQVVWGAAVGLAIATAWVGTQWLATRGFDGLPVVSHSFSAPVGETLLYIMTSSGAQPSFAIGSVTGIVVGSALGSLFQGHFRWEACEDPRELRRQIFGAALMGWGAVTAAGCSIGQGLSAFSLLAFSAPLTLGAIYIGTAIGLRQVIEGWPLRQIN